MPRKTVADWEAKGWTRLDLPAGRVSEEIAYDPTTQDLVVKGQLYDADGQQLTGTKRPKVSVEQTETGGTINLRTASKDVVVLLYKIVEEDEDEEDDGA